MEKKFFVQFTGPWGGTEMERKLKEYAREKFNKTIVTEAQVSEITDMLRDRQKQLKNEHRNWKAVEITKTDGGALSHVKWIYIGDTTSLIAHEVRNDFSQSGMSINETIGEGKA